MLRGLRPVDIALALESKAAKPESFPSTVANCPPWPSPLPQAGGDRSEGPQGSGRMSLNGWALDPKPQPEKVHFCLIAEVSLKKCLPLVVQWDEIGPRERA